MKRSFRIDTSNRTREDVEREIALHLDLRAKEFEAQGMSPEAARAAAAEAHTEHALAAAATACASGGHGVRRISAPCA